MTQSDTDDSLTIPVEVGLDSSWSAIVVDASDRAALADRTEQAVASLLTTLGLPGRPRAEITLRTGDGTDERAPLMTLRVNGRSCRFDEAVLLKAHSYTAGTPLAPLDVLRDLPQRLRRTSSPANPVAGIRQAAELLGLTCQAALRRQAHLLLTSALVERDFSDLVSTGRNSPDRVLSVLRQLVVMGISVADRVAIRDVFAKHATDDSSGQTVAEALIERLHRAEVRLHVEPNLLRRLTIDHGVNGASLISSMRDELYTELGIRLPSFRFVPDTSLRHDSFRVQFNDVPTMPLIALQHDSILVNDTIEHLNWLEITGEVATNPSSMKPCSIVDRSHEDVLKAAGYKTWDLMDHFIACLAHEMRASAQLLMNRTRTGEMVAKLDQVYPGMERTLRSSTDIDDLTRILRALVAEGVSIRDLGRIAERLIEHEIVAENVQSGDLLAFVRAGLSDAISYKFSQNTQTLVVYLIEPKIEQMLERLGLPESNDWIPESADLDSQSYSMIVDPIRQELRILPSTAQVPVMLTPDRLRPVLRSLLAQEFPRLAVIAYGEIPPSHNILPVARVSQ